jgi:hypothetical protein
MAKRRARTGEFVDWIENTIHLPLGLSAKPAERREGEPLHALDRVDGPLAMVLVILALGHADLLKGLLAAIGGHGDDGNGALGSV